MSAVSKAAPKAPIFLNLSRPRPAHANPTQKALSELQPGQEYIHDHSGYQTPMSVWLAQNRQRLGRPFQYTAHPTRSKTYVITVPEVKGHRKPVMAGRN